MRIKDEEDRYRRGMLVMAQAAQRAERSWLEEALHELLTVDATDDQRP